MPLDTKPSRPQRVPHKKPQLEKQPAPEGDAIAKPTNLDSSNKYAPKEKLGKPTIGVPSGRVEKVGLGGLKTITHYGN